MSNGRTTQPGQNPTGPVRRGDEQERSLVAVPPHGWPGPTDPPDLQHADEDNVFDELNRVQAASWALHQAAILTWSRLSFPKELSGPLRLILRAIEHGCIPRDEWFAALAKFNAPLLPDWGRP